MDERGWPTGIHSHRQELLELSIVGLPAQPDTLKAAIAATAQAALNPLTESLITTDFDNLDTIIGAVPQELDSIGPVLTQVRWNQSNPNLQEIIDALKLYNRQLRGGP